MKAITLFTVILVILIGVMSCKSDSTSPTVPEVVPTPVFTPPAGSYDTPRQITLNIAKDGEVIHYTTDGTEPTESSDTYSTPITVSTTSTIKAKGYKANCTASQTATALYTIDPATVSSPVLSPYAGTYTSQQVVSIGCFTTGAAIYYTTNGSDPTTLSTLYTYPITVVNTTTIKARAFKTGLNPSPISSAAYTINIPLPVATPTFNPPGGTYETGQNITISCATNGATITYTTNGSEPTSNSQQYSNPINISSSTTLKAKAFKQNMADSPVATASYNIGNLTFTTVDEFWNYVESKAWYFIVSEIDYGTKQKYIEFSFENYPQNVSSSDTFTFVVNGVNVPLEVLYGDYLCVAGEDAVPFPDNTNQFNILFKRNNVTIYDGTVTLPSKPYNLSTPQNINLTQAIPISWSLNSNAPMQACDIWGSNSNNQQDSYGAIVAPSARSYTFPANCISVNNIEWGELTVYEMCLYENSNCLVLGGASVSRDISGISTAKTSNHAPRRTLGMFKRHNR